MNEEQELALAMAASMGHAAAAADSPAVAAATVRRAPSAQVRMLLRERRPRACYCKSPWQWSKAGALVANMFLCC